MRDKINTYIKFQETIIPFTYSRIVSPKNNFLDQEIEISFIFEIFEFGTEEQYVSNSVAIENSSARILNSDKNELQSIYYQDFEKLEKKNRFTLC